MGGGEISANAETVDHSTAVEEKKTNYVVIITGVSACQAVIPLWESDLAEKEN